MSKGFFFWATQIKTLRVLINHWSSSKFSLILIVFIYTLYQWTWLHLSSCVKHMGRLGVTPSPFGVLLNTSVMPEFFFREWLKTPKGRSESGSLFYSFLLLLSYITFLEDIGTIVSLNASLHIMFQKHSFRSWWWIREDNLYLSEHNINLRKEVSRIILVFLSSK